MCVCVSHHMCVCVCVRCLYGGEGRITSVNFYAICSIFFNAITVLMHALLILILFCGHVSDTLLYYSFFLQHPGIEWTHTAAMPCTDCVRRWTTAARSTRSTWLEPIQRVRLEWCIRSPSSLSFFCFISAWLPIASFYAETNVRNRDKCQK